MSPETGKTAREFLQLFATVLWIVLGVQAIHNARVFLGCLGMAAVNWHAIGLANTMFNRIDQLLDEWSQELRRRAG